MVCFSVGTNILCINNIDKLISNTNLSMLVVKQIDCQQEVIERV